MAAVWKGGRRGGKAARDAALFERIIRDIGTLETSITALRHACQAMARSRDPRLFRKLWDEVGNTLSFLAVLAGRAESLDPVRQGLTLIRLGQLRETVVELHLRSVEPLLADLAAGRRRLTLGTDYVMTRWLTHLEVTWADLEAERQRVAAQRAGTQQERGEEAPGLQQAALADEEAAHDRLAQALERSATLARAIIAAAPPGLPDFSQEPPPAPSPPLLRSSGRRRPAALLAAPLSPPHGGAGATQLAAPGDDGRDDKFGVIFLLKRDGNLYVDPDASGAGVRAIRVGGKLDAVAKIMGVARHRLTTILAGRDPVSFTQLTRLQTALEEVSGGGVSARVSD